jgi:hypothetical protein
MRSDAGPRHSREYLSAYISGYVDGEGCFTVSISPRTKPCGWVGGAAKPLCQSERRPGRGASVDSRPLRVRSIRPDCSDKTLKWETRRLEDLLVRVIPHFERYPLLSGKRLDFECFASVCRSMATGGHRTPAGLVDIVELAARMYPSGKRRYRAEEILASLRQGEGIVCASGNGGITRSSDLHEWRNDLDAVSTRGSVKLQSR